MTAEPTYLLASELPGVEEAWDEWQGGMKAWHGQAPRLPARFIPEIPADAAFLCLCWGPLVDAMSGRWKGHGRRCPDGIRHYMDDRGDAIRAHWLSLLDDPVALAAECRAMVAAMEGQ